MYVREVKYSFCYDLLLFKMLSFSGGNHSLSHKAFLTTYIFSQTKGWNKNVFILNFW